MQQADFNTQPQRKDIMKKYISYTMIALLATVAVSTAATNEDAMMEKEKAAWQAFKDKKPDDFKKVVSAKLVAVYTEGMSDMQKELADMQKWDMKSFAISDYKVTSDGSDTIVSTYKVAVEGSEGPMPDWRFEPCVLLRMFFLLLATDEHGFSQI